jgi:hypothetical protein
VPFEENDGRGKDRPVLVVAVEPAGTYLAVQLIGKDHDGEGDFVSVGAGGWDGEHRPSWVNLDRVIRVHEGGMRREAAALPREPFERVTDRLHQRYGWHQPRGSLPRGPEARPASTSAPPRAMSGPSLPARKPATAGRLPGIAGQRHETGGMVGITAPTPAVRARP